MPHRARVARGRRRVAGRAGGQWAVLSYLYARKQPGAGAPPTRRPPGTLSIAEHPLNAARRRSNDLIEREREILTGLESARPPPESAGAKLKGALA